MDDTLTHDMVLRFEAIEARLDALENPEEVDQSPPEDGEEEEVEPTEVEY